MFGDISVEEFLRDYWQKKPLLIRNAFPNFQSPITQDELAGLACETDAARIVIEQGGAHPWEVRHGAFDDDDFSNLPETHWTLLVNDTDQHLPELKAIIEPFRFIPDWRIDDLMISFAVEGGSVGPHVDQYDVFLLQAQGQRRWQITTQPTPPDNFLPDLELRIMRDFSAEQEWIVEPGDLLYLPPNVPHYGVALNECMTYSVGFRAPSQADMLEKLLEDSLDDERLKQRFSDTERQQQGNPGELTATDMDRLVDFLVDALPQDEQSLQQWLGKYLTSPKANAVQAEGEAVSRAELSRLIRQKKKFEKTLDARLMYFLSGNELHLFANGNHYDLASQHLQFIEYLCKSSVLIPKDYAHFLTESACFDTLQELLETGVFTTRK
ncbi:cupin domain-containing protein [Thiothrix fructosivorans]|uniref:Cupin domain-containing protein n=2 Tax=Thiothrix fructosivorans TaxID=111770 RepID=A0A8B0SKN9_9GAMM|nr:cupin domain-containing protein [Thiothrix fructosivorans]QTX12833.1 cupin domain-containing protein [Thiothrix fructosivorans]